MHRLGSLGLSRCCDRRPSGKFRRAAMRPRLLLIPFALAACGKKPTSEPQVTPPETAAPRTLDKGDGCTVEITKEGSGPGVSIGDEVTIAYEMRLKDSEASIASTSGWDVPCRVRLGERDVLPGLSRGIEGLRVGSKARIEVPCALGYGKDGCAASGVPPDASLVFEVEVLGARR